MSVFYISNNVEKVKFANSRFEKVFGKKFIIHYLTSDSQITFCEDKAFKKEFDNGKLFGFGLFFSDDGFFGDALKNVNSLNNFKKLQENGLFGHYTFVIVENNNLYIITDKVGMLNVFYHKFNDDFCVSTDLPLLGITSAKCELSPQGVKEFIFNESTVGSTTIFKDIKRLKFGNEIYVSKNSLKEKKSHDYEFEDLSFEEYTKRIEYYFKLLNKYESSISTDISGGFDTRLIASIAHKTVLGIEANTNPNQFDGGVDNTLSPIIAEKLNLKLTKLENKKECNDRLKMLHYFSIGRDVIRSRFWPSRLEDKYKEFNLSLGGYGGETIRAKYNNQSAADYYAVSEDKRELHDKNYTDFVKNELNHYSEYKTNKQETNLIYTVDRMRIWGGTQVYANFINGATLHPFMDWYLINPVFNMGLDELKKGRLQRRLILHFAPQLKGIPVNKLNNSNFDFSTIKFTLKKLILKSGPLTRFVKMMRSMSKKKQMQVETLYEKYPKSKINIEAFRQIGINLDDIEKIGKVEVLSRLITVNEALSYTKMRLYNNE